MVFILLFVVVQTYWMLYFFSTSLALSLSLCKYFSFVFFARNVLFAKNGMFSIVLLNTYLNEILLSSMLRLEQKYTIQVHLII